MNQAGKAEQFTNLHVKGSPVVLFNIWDAGSAKAVASAGAKAIATGSHSVAAAQGFDDGEAIPLEFVERNTRQICSAVSLPVTIDFEGGYAESPDEINHDQRPAYYWRWSDWYELRRPDRQWERPVQCFRSM